VGFRPATAAEASEGADQNVEASADSLDKDDLTSTSILPIGFYTPETELGLGGAVGYFFKKSPEQRPNNVSGLLFYTTKSQWLFALTSEVYSSGATRHYMAEASFEKFPYSFWGIGNSTTDDMEELYTPKAIGLEFLVERKLYSAWQFGAIYQFWYQRITEMEEGGLLDSGEIVGSTGGYSSGLGIITTWDTRDNIYYSKRGTFVQLQTIYAGPGLGSDFEYTFIDFDARQFIALVGEYSLGLRGVLRATTGNAPFQAMPGVGGASYLRGYPGDRYIDNTAATLQAEFRTAYFWRISLVGFGCMAAVADRVGNLQDAPVRYSGGIGARFRLNKEHFNVRIDMGFGEGTSGFYFVAGEAF
jgi:outer membrane protein assembly factor BamA